jgi:putative acetyltransferase
MQPWVIAAETPDQPEVAALLALADARSASLYPVESRHGLSLDALLAQAARFYVARIDGVARGCGGYIPLPEQAAEMKRVFVAAEARGRGIGRAIVEAVEAAAAAEGARRMYLETGVKSDEAMRLYRRLGYAECGHFAGYRSDPLSVFMVKALVGGDGASAVRRCPKRGREPC